MSTQVTYKGNTIANFTNDTKTLKTAGKYMEDDVTITESIASGTAGTPTASKSTVSNHSVSVTPSVTNTTGYISGGTKTGTAVTVSASELVSGTYSVTSSGTKDVTNYASASVPSLTLPSAASSTSSGTSKATISRSTSNQYINIPTGFNNTAQYYTVSATPNGTVTAPSTITGTTATVSTGTNTLTLTKSVSVTPNVTTAGYISSGTAGNASVSLTASVTTKAAATITPGTTNQTIASGTYLTGSQTIKGDANLIAANIVSGASIFGVSGTANVVKYTATITQTGNSSYLFVKYPGQNGTKYYTSGDTFEIHPNDEIYLRAQGIRGGGFIYVNDELVASNPNGSTNYTYTVPAATNIEISLNYSSDGYIYLTATRSELSITQNGEYDVSEYGYAIVNVPSGNNNVVVFTTDDDFESFVCDKSFAQCFNLVDVHLLSAAYIHDTSYGANNVYGLIAGYYSSTEIHYVFGGQHTGKPYGDIVYHSNGTIEFVTPSTAAAVIQPLSITQNGTYTAPTGVDGYSPITVNVPSGGGTYQTKTVSPSTSQQTVTPDSGYDALSSVTVNAMPTGTATAPTSISGTAATVSTGTNTLTLTKTVSVTPRITTSGYISSGTAGNASVSLTANVTTKASATIIPGTTNQTIASGTYLTGTQTIAGDADLVGGNILSTANIFGVQGTVVVQNYYTGSSAPSSSTGSNGDLYLQS